MALYIMAEGCVCDCDLNITIEGGDAGFDDTYDLMAGGGSLKGAGSLDIDWTFNTIADQLQVFLDGSGTPAYDTGCTTGSGGTTLALPSCTSSVRFLITPICAGGTGTYWLFSAVCSVP
jgi:hypothetical protein